MIGRDVDLLVVVRWPSSSRKTLTPSLRPISAIGIGLSPTEKTIGKWRCTSELVDRDRNRVGGGHARRRRKAADLHLAVLRDVERLEAL